MYIHPKCINIPGKSYPFTGTPIFNNTEKRLPIYRNLSRQKAEPERMTQPPKGRPLEAKLAAGSQLCHTANKTTLTLLNNSKRQGHILLKVMPDQEAVTDYLTAK